MIVTSFRVRLNTFIVLAVTNQRCVKNEHAFIYLPFWDILSCNRTQWCKEIQKMRQAENKEVHSRRQQWPKHSCLVCITKLRQCGAA